MGSHAASMHMWVICPHGLGMMVVHWPAMPAAIASAFPRVMLASIKHMDRHDGSNAAGQCIARNEELLVWCEYWQTWHSWQPTCASRTLAHPAMWHLLMLLQCACVLNMCMQVRHQRGSWSMCHARQSWKLCIPLSYITGMHTCMAGVLLQPYVQALVHVLVPNAEPTRTWRVPVQQQQRSSRWRHPSPGIWQPPQQLPCPDCLALHNPTSQDDTGWQPGTHRWTVQRCPILGVWDSAMSTP